MGSSLPSCTGAGTRYFGLAATFLQPWGQSLTSPAHEFFQISTAYCFWSQTTVFVFFFFFLNQTLLRAAHQHFLRLSPQRLSQRTISVNSQGHWHRNLTRPAVRALGRGVSSCCFPERPCQNSHGDGGGTWRSKMKGQFPKHVILGVNI